MINQNGGGTIFRFYGGHSCYEGDVELMGGPPVSPLGKTLIWETSAGGQSVNGGTHEGGHRPYGGI